MSKAIHLTFQQLFKHKLNNYLVEYVGDNE